MTVQQADDINTIFSLYKDSLSNYKDTVLILKNKINYSNKIIEVNNQKINLLDTIIKNKDLQIDQYKKEMVRIEKLEFIEKRTRVRVGLGLGAVITTWLVFIFTAVK